MKLFSLTKKEGVKKYAKGTFAISPQRNFRYLMMVTLLVLVAVIGLHLYLFYRLRAQNIFSSGEGFAQQGQKINERKLEDVLVRFNAKDAARMAASSRVPVVLDPSR